MRQDRPVHQNWYQLGDQRCTGWQSWGLRVLCFEPDNPPTWRLSIRDQSKRHDNVLCHTRNWCPGIWDELWNAELVQVFWTYAKLASHSSHTWSEAHMTKACLANTLARIPGFHWDHPYGLATRFWTLTDTISPNDMAILWSSSSVSVWLTRWMNTGPHPCQHNESIKRGDELTVPPFTGTWKHEHVVR